MTIFDACLLAILVISIVQGLRLGLLRQVIALAGAVLAWIAACHFGPQLTPWIFRFTSNLWLAEIFSFLLIALTVMLIAHVIGRAVAGGAKTIGLGWLDRIAGAAFGFLRGVFVVAFCFLILSLFFPDSGWVRSSRVAPWGLRITRTLAAAAPPQTAARIRSGAHALHLEIGNQYGPAQ